MHQGRRQSKLHVCCQSILNTLHVELPVKECKGNRGMTPFQNCLRQWHTAGTLGAANCMSAKGNRV